MKEATGLREEASTSQSVVATAAQYVGVRDHMKEGGVDSPDPSPSSQKLGLPLSGRAGGSALICVI